MKQRKQQRSGVLISVVGWCCVASSLRKGIAFSPTLLSLRIKSNPAPPVQLFGHSSFRNSNDNDDDPFVPVSLLHASRSTLKRRQQQQQRTRQHLVKNPQQQQQQESVRLDWLLQTTDSLLNSKPGTLNKGKWHQVVSMLKAWSDLITTTSAASASAASSTPAQQGIINWCFQLEGLLKRLVEERQAGNAEVSLPTALYNRVLDAWACAALTKKGNNNNNNSPGTDVRIASQRAREILVLMQETYEEEVQKGKRTSKDNNNNNNNNHKDHEDHEDNDQTLLKPNKESFDIVLHAACKTEGAIIARRILAWMEHLYKTGKNTAAKPTKEAVVLILDAYANSAEPNAGVLAEAFMRHMQITAGIEPDTLCYNIAIKAYSKSSSNNNNNNSNAMIASASSSSSRTAAEHAHRILDEMKTLPDLVTYSTVIAAWAASGMRALAVSRVEEILRAMEQQKLAANTVVLNAVMSTWVKSRNPAAVGRTGEILKQMQVSAAAAAAAALVGVHHHNHHHLSAPDLVSYNTHLHALSMHAHKNPEYAHRAEAILRRLEGQSDMALAPNCFSYNLVIEAFCHSQMPNATAMAANVLRRLVHRDGVEPDTFSFNQVLTALSRSGAAQTAENLLLYMEESYRSGVHPNAKPDAMSYSSVTVAYARSGEKGAAYRAEKLLARMKERYVRGESDVKPTRICYNALIDCWAKSGEGTFAARKAEAVLERMQAMFVAGDKSMAPDLVTFNAVLNAWARSGTRCCGRKAETYLNRMWELYQAGDKRVKPNDFSYNTVINAISKSKDERKAQKALRVLRRMDKLYQAGNKEARPNEITYTAVLNSCAFPAAGSDPNIRRKALDTAIFTLDELQKSRYGQPNQITYGTFIKACANLLPDGDETRRNAIKRAFRQCCKDGQVGDMVLAQIRRAAPADLMEELLPNVFRQQRQQQQQQQQQSSAAGHGGGGIVISVNDLPLEWRCNVRRVGEKSRQRGHMKPYSSGSRTTASTAARRRTNDKARGDKGLNP